MDDLSTIDGLLGAFYAAVSGPAGSEPDWQRERSLFLPEAVLVRASRVGDDTPGAAVMDLDGFISGSAEYLRDRDFYERESDRKVETFGNLAHVMSASETSTDPDGRDITSRGARLCENTPRGSKLALPDLQRIVLDPAGPGEVLRKFVLIDRCDAPVALEENGAG